MKHLENLFGTLSLTASNVAISGKAIPNPSPVKIVPIIDANGHRTIGTGINSSMRTLNKEPNFFVLPPQNLIRNLVQFLGLICHNSRAKKKKKWYNKMNFDITTNDNSEKQEINCIHGKFHMQNVKRL